MAHRKLARAPSDKMRKFGNYQSLGERHGPGADRNGQKSDVSSRPCPILWRPETVGTPSRLKVRDRGEQCLLAVSERTEGSAVNTVPRYRMLGPVEAILWRRTRRVEGGVSGRVERALWPVAGVFALRLQAEIARKIDHEKQHARREHEGANRRDKVSSSKPLPGRQV